MGKVHGSLARAGKVRQQVSLATSLLYSTLSVRQKSTRRRWIKGAETVVEGKGLVGNGRVDRELAGTRLQGVAVGV